jgi:competence protein ComEA
MRALNMDELYKQGPVTGDQGERVMKSTKMQWMKNALLAMSLAVSASVFAVQTGQPVNINTADAQAIADNLNGIGLKKAEAIIAYRKEHGPFKTLEDLKEVKGIGDATVANNEKLIQLE